jgi:hypothetical protein
MTNSSSPALLLLPSADRGVIDSDHTATTKRYDQAASSPAYASSSAYASTQAQPSSTTAQPSSPPPHTPPKRQRQRRSSTQQEPRTIYNPYAESRQSSSSSPFTSSSYYQVEGDVWDRLGGYVADIADRIMWGKDAYQSMHSPSYYQSPPAASRASPSAYTASTASSTSSSETVPSSEPDMSSTDSSAGSPSGTATGAYTSTRSDREQSARQYADPYRSVYKGNRHWKDRLEQQLDTWLGINKGDGYYNSWMEREQEETAGQSDKNDAYSVAQGRQRRDQHKVRPKQSNKPIWEQEGNLISLLFGRTQNGHRLPFDHWLDSNSGSLVFVFQTLFRSAMLCASYIGRWASVRGALPQPVVIMGVTAAGLCARPRHRVRAIIISLILLRTLGEVVHGALYDNEHWEDDTEEA